MANYEQALALGFGAEKLDALLTRVRREIDEGLLSACQIALARHGQIALVRSFGKANDDSLFCIFSATKGITSAAIWLLLQGGKLRTEELVADIIPEFANNDKAAVTVEQLLTHTAGFPAAPFRSLDWLDNDKRLQRFAQWRLSWQPGSRFEYHPTATMWVLAEIIERRSGRPFTQFVAEEICAPLGLKNLLVGMTAPQSERAVACEHVGEALTAEDYQKLGMPVPPVTEVTEEAILSFNRPEIQAVGVPGGGGFANATDLALFYQALLHGGLPAVSEATPNEMTPEREIWGEKIRQRGTRIYSGELTDPVFRKAASRGLGVIIAGDDDRSYRGFGKTNSPASFGHNGAGGQLAWVDPQTGISLSYLTNGHDRNPVRQGRRGVAIGSLAAACLA